MGTYLNPGSSLFEEALDSTIYIDKTDMISHLNTLVRTSQKYACVSRPRRFGKSMAANMVCAYFDRTADSRALFEGTKLSECPQAHVGRRTLPWDAYLGAFDVVRLVMTDFFRKRASFDAALARMQRLVTRELMAAYPDVDYFDADDLAQSIDDVHATTGRCFVFVIDEWDIVFREEGYGASDQKRYLDFLKVLLKDKPYVALAYMTGILPVKKYGVHSALNMFGEYTMLDPAELAPYTGFTEEEVRALCDRFGQDFGRMREWYDGYEVAGVAPVPAPGGTRGEAPRYRLFCPLSVVEAVRRGRVANYWYHTVAYETLGHYIRSDFDGLQEKVALLVDGKSLFVKTSSFANDMHDLKSADDVLTLLVHLGYLGFDPETSEARIPNREVMDAFRESTHGGGWGTVFRQLARSREVLEATWAADADRVAALVEEATGDATNLTYNSEAALSYAIRRAYMAAEEYYTVLTELDSGKGFCDIAYLPSPKHPAMPALVVELKFDWDAKGALSQIRQRNYPARLAHYASNILLVGVNYDRDLSPTDPAYKHHACVIERA